MVTRSVRTNEQTNATNGQHNKKLCYAEGPRDALLVNSCYILRRKGVRNDSNTKSDLQDHSRALAMVPFDGPHTISY